MNLKVSVNVNSYYFSLTFHLFFTTFFFSYNILKQILYTFVFIYCCNK